MHGLVVCIPGLSLIPAESMWSSPVRRSRLPCASPSADIDPPVEPGNQEAALAGSASRHGPRNLPSVEPHRFDVGPAADGASRAKVQGHDLKAEARLILLNSGS